MPRLEKTLAPLSLALALALLTGARAQSPEISSIAPHSARPGQSVQVTVLGNQLQAPQPLWTSFGAQTLWTPPAPPAPPKEAKDTKDGKPAKPDLRQIQGSLTLPADAPLGLGFIRLPTATGLSGPLLFLVDDLPVVLKDSKTASTPAAQLLPQGVALEGATDTGRPDYYKVALKAGEALSVEVFAARLGSKLDPILRLLDPQGNVLASLDDSPGLAGDCRLRHHAKTDEVLTLEIRDSSFSGGAPYFYHLRVGDFPLVSNLFPPVAAPGASVEVRAAGEAVEGIGPLRVSASVSPTGVASVPVRFAPDKPAAFARLRTDANPVYLHQNTPDAAQPLPVTIPCTIFGRLLTPGARDTFLLSVKKDDRLTLTPLSRELGSPAVLYVGVEDAKGGFLSANDAAGTSSSNDVPVTFRAPADGVCKIAVEDIARRGGREFIYGIRVEQNTPGLELTASVERFVAALGGNFSLKITAQRRGVNGPITLSLATDDGSPLPEGIRCEKNIIEKGKNDTQLQVFVPENVPSGTLYHLRILGSAVEGERQIQAAVSPPKPDPNKPPTDTVLLALQSMPLAPRLLGETFPVCVGPEAPHFFSIAVTDREVVLPTLVGKNSFVVRQTSLDPKFDGNAQLSFSGLPPGVEIKSEAGRGGRIAGQVDFICEIKGPPDLPLASHVFEILAGGDFKGVHKEVRLSKVKLRVAKPLAIAAAPPAALAPGGKRILKITATRYELTDPQPIQVSLLQLPQGISGPQQVTIAPGSSEAELELTAEPNTPEGKSGTLRLAATTRVNGAEVSLQSEPIPLEVKK